MIYRILTIFISLLMIRCSICKPSYFSKEALEDTLVTIDRDSITIQEIIGKYKGKKTYIQFFATYCPVSQRSFKAVKQLQKEYPNKNYLFFSVDHTFHDWKRGLESLDIKGTHYYLPKKGESKIAKFLKLKGVPRFMVLNEKGEIILYKATKISKTVKSKIKFP